jgi:membrane-associated protease RseP (regulator of RpoE activity)
VKGTETDEEVVEEERPSGAAGLLVLAGLVALLGVQAGWSAVAVVAALVVVIFLHELGHFLTAKWAGMKVTEFFLGFGPRLWSFRRGETEYGIKGIPAGAYVRIIGMNNLDEVDPADESRTYRAKPYWRRASVAVAGSAMHFLLAFVLACTVFIGFRTVDISSSNWTLASVSGPAKAAGLLPGDRIVSVDGVARGSFQATSRAIQARPGERVTVVVERDGARRSLPVQLGRRHPITGDRVGYLGVAPRLEASRHGLLDGVPRAVQEMGTVAKDSVVGLGKLFSPSGIERYLDNLTGEERVGAGGVPAEGRPSSVVGIVQAGSQAAENGWVDVVYLLFGVNMFIGIFNLVPLLPFDGGHLAIATYEKIRGMISGRRHQVDVAKLLPLTYAVVLVLALLFVTTIYLDIVRPQSFG